MAVKPAQPTFRRGEGMEFLVYLQNLEPEPLDLMFVNHATWDFDVMVFRADGQLVPLRPSVIAGREQARRHPELMVDTRTFSTIDSAKAPRTKQLWLEEFVDIEEPGTYSLVVAWIARNPRPEDQLVVSNLVTFEVEE